MFKGFQIENWRDIKILSNSLNYNKLSKIHFWCFVIPKFEKLLDLQLCKCFRKLFRKITNFTNLDATWIWSLGGVNSWGMRFVSFCFSQYWWLGVLKNIQKRLFSPNFRFHVDFATFKCKWEKNHQNTTKSKV